MAGFDLGRVGLGLFRKKWKFARFIIFIRRLAVYLWKSGIYFKSLCVFLFKMSFRKSFSFKNWSYEDHLFGVNFKTRKKTPWPALESFFVMEPPKILNFRLSSQNLTLLPLQKTMLKIFVSISSTKKVEIFRLLFNVIIVQLTLLIHQRCSRGQMRTIFLI